MILMLLQQVATTRLSLPSLPQQPYLACLMHFQTASSASSGPDHGAGLPAAVPALHKQQHHLQQPLRQPVPDYGHTTAPGHQLLPASREALALLRRFNVSLPHPRGQAILARVIKATPTSLLLDPGYYGVTEVATRDLGSAQTYFMNGNPHPQAEGLAKVRVGDLVRVRLSQLFTPCGDMQLDPVRTDPGVRHKLVWEELERRKNSGRPVLGRVLNPCKGGYAVGVAGYVALLPHGQGTVPCLNNIGSLQSFYIYHMHKASQMIKLSNHSTQSTSGLYSNIAPQPARDTMA